MSRLVNSRKYECASKNNWGPLGGPANWNYFRNLKLTVDRLTRRFVDVIDNDFAVRVDNKLNLEMGIEVLGPAFTDESELIVPEENVRRIPLDNLHPFFTQNVLASAGGSPSNSVIPRLFGNMLYPLIILASAGGTSISRRTKRESVAFRPCVCPVLFLLAANIWPIGIVASILEITYVHIMQPKELLTSRP